MQPDMNALILRLWAYILGKSPCPCYNHYMYTGVRWDVSLAGSRIGDIAYVSLFIPQFDLWSEVLKCYISLVIAQAITKLLYTYNRQLSFCTVRCYKANSKLLVLKLTQQFLLHTFNSKLYWRLRLLRRKEASYITIIIGYYMHVSKAKISLLLTLILGFAYNNKDILLLLWCWD